MAKLSKYNIVVKDNENYILYNALFSNIVMLSEEEYTAYKSIKDSCIVNNIFLEQLKENNYIVDDDFNEIEYYKLRWYRSLFSSGILRHTILPNLSCNCDCPYCFEEKNGSFMTIETANAYLNWLEPQLKSIKHFYVSWFGGEPLLSKKLLQYLSEKIIELSNKYHFEYEACIVTNGTLLDEGFIAKMADLHIKSVQITFDGDRDLHNQYRFFKNTHHGTFDVIMNNLRQYCEISESDVASILRVNVTDENYNSIPSFLKSVPKVVKEKCVVIFRWVYSHSYGRNPGIEFSEKLKGKTPYSNLSKLYSIAEDEGFNTNTFDEGLNCNYCECDFDHAYQIDQDGDIFMCTHSMDKEETIGNVRNGFEKQRNLSRYSKFINANPFSDPECLSCKILPICRGGCRKARYLGEKSCSYIKYSLEEYVIDKAHKHISLCE